jgi:hypothetical protein
VEQAADGRTFQQVQSINAQSASGGGVQSYSFLIPETLRQSSFWRIKAIEWDGSTTFSKIIRLSELSNNNEAMFQVLQNPVRLGEVVKIQWLRNDLVQPAYTWFDVSGRRLSSGRLRAPIGSNQLIVPPPTTSGLYKILIQAQTNTGEFVRSSHWVFMQ